MRNVSLSELKAYLSRYLHKVRRGEIRIPDCGVPVARLAVLLPSGDAADEKHRRRLARSGLLRLKTSDMSAFLEMKPVLMSGDISGALAEDREDRT